MSITDELREFASHCAGGMGGDALTNIADRIDERVENIRFNEHHKGYQDGIMDGCLHYDPEHTECMVSEEHGYIKLPVDADGVLIHIGDVMEWVNDKNVARTVSGVGTDVFFAWSKDNNRYIQYEAKDFRHRCEPTVEDVLREFADEFNRDDTEMCDDEIIERFAGRIREVVE